jgi:hypothetical protein
MVDMAMPPPVLVRLPEGSTPVCDFRHSSNRSGGMEWEDKPEQSELYFRTS